VDAANDMLGSLERSLEALAKQHTDTAVAHRGLMKVERQRTEEAHVDLGTLLAQLRDNLEARIQSEGADIRAALADCRKKSFEEANSLRVEIRAQPSKKEVVEVAATATEQYNELVAALDSHRARLETAVGDFASRCREVRTEASDARLQMQRQTMTMGNELQQLRAAATSLTNGVIKGLQVIGFVREEESLRRLVLDSERMGPPPSPRTGTLAPLSTRPVPSSGDGSFRNIEIEDLLEWEKLGKSLASRITRQWSSKEQAGFTSVLSMLEQKADTASVEELKTTMKGSLPLGMPMSPFKSAPVPPLPSEQVKQRHLRGYA